MNDRVVHECICGADIYQEKGTTDWYNVNDVQGTALYCYPDMSGPDGRAKHEPDSEPVFEEDNDGE